MLGNISNNKVMLGNLKMMLGNVTNKKIMLGKRMTIVEKCTAHGDNGHDLNDVTRECHE